MWWSPSLKWWFFDVPFTELTQDEVVLQQEVQDRLWRVSLKLCNDEPTTQIAAKYAGTTI